MKEISAPAVIGQLAERVLPVTVRRSARHETQDGTHDASFQDRGSRRVKEVRSKR